MATVNENGKLDTGGASKIHQSVDGGAYSPACKENVVAERYFHFIYGEGDICFFLAPDFECLSPGRRGTG